MGTRRGFCCAAIPWAPAPRIRTASARTPTRCRDNFTLIYNAAGRHELRVGGEYLHTLNHLLYPQLAYGQIDATGGQLSASQIQEIFPVWNDFRTWNLAALSPVTQVLYQGVCQQRRDVPSDGHVCHLAPERLDPDQAAHRESGVALRRVARRRLAIVSVPSNRSVRPTSSSRISRTSRRGSDSRSPGPTRP